jgi:PAS domain-containing protein
MCLFQSAINIFEEDGLLFIDKNNKVLRWNEYYKDLIGYPDEVLETRDLNQYLKYLKPMLADLDDYEEGLREVMESKDVTLHYCKLKDGRIIRRQIYPIYNNDQFYGRILRLKDVTEETKSHRNHPRKGNG